MFYHLAQHFSGSSLGNFLHYVSVRSIGALMTSLCLYFIFGRRFLRLSEKLFRSQVRDDTPDSHQIKNDTPTMGGLIILVVFVANTCLWNNLARPEVWLLVACLLSFGVIGFIDDWSKVRARRGLGAKAKFILQCLSAGFVVVVWHFLMSPGTRLCVPAIKFLDFDMGLLAIPWAMFLIVAASNAVNLTDGLDGLATGPLITNLSAFGAIAYLAGHKYFAIYLHIPHMSSSEITICCTSLIGVLLGFLWHNTYPAQIFMGDIGSLSLGAGLAFIALLTGQELLLAITGGIFVLETVSVLAQVASYRLLGRRIFLMAPIHHHFELKGWNEAKITIRFWIISFLLALVALLLLKIR
ncbi:phospho-N-acetylmuramoyl-pentapeptide-transferase [bacterium]|nr:phospho-N-acetylmuramoyl-pentapeptide-transferase [bacterium]